MAADRLGGLFALPEVSDEAAEATLRLRATALDLSEEQWEAVRPAFGGEEPVAYFSSDASSEGHPFGFYGHVGATQAEEPSVDCWGYLHYHLTLIGGGTLAAEEHGEGWADLLKALSPVVGEHDSRMVFDVRLAADTYSPTLALPISVAVPGFTAISGVRLVKENAEGRALYSVIVDRHDDDYSVSAGAVLQWRLDSDLLVHAWNRGLEIAHLAFRRTGERHE